MIKYKKYKLPNGEEAIREEHYNKEGQLHCLDGPALYVENYCEAWYYEGKLHKSGGEAAITTYIPDPSILDYEIEYQGWFEHGVCLKTEINGEVKYEREK